MTERISLDELRRKVREPAELNGDTFAVLRAICSLTNSLDQVDVSNARELTIRLLDDREQLDEQYQDLINGLVRTHGLFPYLDPNAILGEADLIAYESHRPRDFPDDEIVFHHAQSMIYNTLMDGENVILSAPTSFGKSLIIDALVASGNYSNIVIVVPTLALIDETRRRLAERFSAQFKIVTHPSQRTEERNIFVYTQERVVDHRRFPELDLFVIDEFYKLDAQDSDSERSALLNQALYKLLKTGAQFYFLGPNIERLTPDLAAQINARFIQTDFSTVAIDVEAVDRHGSEIESLVRLCTGLSEPTLIYCRSPRQTRDVAEALLDAGFLAPNPRLSEAAGWVGDTYDPNWLVARALSSGIGIHNGMLPRALAQFMVRSFNSGELRFLVCTSTLIEGVNTAAKNVVIYSNQIARRRFDYFTFNNIRGRSGRMFQHFVGRVFLFHPQPAPQLPFVDVPVVSQPESAPSSLLIQIDDQDLSARSVERLRPIISQDFLSVETIRNNNGVLPESQIEVARTIRSESERLHPLLAWSRLPSYEQLVATSNLAWVLSGFSGQRSGVSSGSQLALKLNRLQRNPETRRFIEALASRSDSISGDDRVESALEFVRQWAGHHAPRLFGALNAIQTEVFSSVGMQPGNYSFYVWRLQNQFLPSNLSAIDEYGLPIDVAMKIRERLDLSGGLDELLDSIRTLRLDSLVVSEFERRLIAETQASLG